MQVGFGKNWSHSQEAKTPQECSVVVCYCYSTANSSHPFSGAFPDRKRDIGGTFNNHVSAGGAVPAVLCKSLSRDLWAPVSPYPLNAEVMGGVPKLPHTGIEPSTFLSIL